MMNRKTLGLLLLTLAAAVACKHEDPPKTGCVTLTVATGAPVTRSVNGTAADGGEIVVDNGVPDIFIAIANYSGNIVAIYDGADVQDGEGHDVVKCLTANSTEATISFPQITSGEYTVYAIGNKSDLWDLDDYGVPAKYGNSFVPQRASQLDSLVFEQPAGDTPTVASGHAMPLSAKGTLSVNENLNGQAELDLLRCVGKVGFKFKNETGDNITLTDCTVTIFDINQTQGYVFPKAEPDTAGVPGNLSLNMGQIQIANGETTALYEMQKVFPSIAPARDVGRRYFCTIQFSLGGSVKRFENLPIHDKQSQDIQALGRNQYLQIETRISKGLRISFNYEVANWDPIDEAIIFH